MWTFTHIALGAGLAGALLLASPTRTSAGGSIGSALGEFEVKSSRPMACVVSSEARFDVGSHGYVPLVGSDRVEAAVLNSPMREAAAQASPFAGRKNGLESSTAACGAGPSRTRMAGTPK